MKKILVRIILLAAAVAVTAGGALLLKQLRPGAEEEALTVLREAAPLLALAADAPQVRAVVTGDGQLIPALKEVFCVEGCDSIPDQPLQEQYDLGVIAAAPAFQTDGGRRSLLRAMARRTLQQGDVLVIPTGWAALADFPCRRTPVAGTNSRYCFLSPENQKPPTLQELSRRLTKRQQEAGFDEYPEGILEAYYGIDDPPCPVPAAAPPPELPRRMLWVGLVLLLILAAVHLILSGRSVTGNRRCRAFENGAAAACVGVGTFTAAAAFQMEWGIDPVSLTLLAAAGCIMPAGPGRGERSVALLAATVLAAATVLLKWHGEAPWCGLLLLFAAAFSLLSAGWSTTRTTLFATLVGILSGAVAGIVLARSGAEPALILALALVLRSGFLLKV